MESVSSPRPRIDWLDAAKACGMFLVFFGHIVESVAHSDNPAAFVQQKLVYSFHMPLFILLSGSLARSAPDLPRLWPFLKRQAASRLLPVVFFSVLMMPFFPLDEVLREYLPTGPAAVRPQWIGDEVCRRLNPPAEGEQARPARRLWESLPPSVQSTVREGASSGELGEKGREEIAAALNQALARPDLFALEDFSAARLSADDRAWLVKDRARLPEDALRRHNMGLMWQGLFPEDSGGDEWTWLWQAEKTLFGYTLFCVPAWFLVCLFVVELIHFAVVRLLSGPLRIGLAVPFFFGAGWLLNRDAQVFSDIWYARESVFLYGFYLVGFLLRQTGLLERIGGGWSRWALFAAGSAALWFTFDLNPGSRVFAPLVLVNHSQHGNSMWFILTALAGSLAVVGLARLVPTPRSLTYVGRHSLILMGLNGFFFSFANEYLAEWMNLPPLPGTVLLWCTAVTMASLAVCVPMVWLLDRYVPQLVGRPRAHGPLLPRLVQ